ncbi:hypothetical protein BJX62DRAFT_236600 [Aspergillus germanicus]
MPRLQSLVSILLLSRSFIPAVSAVSTEVSEIVTCATSTPNPFSNPSFEDGITGWGFASGTTGSVVSGDAADGSSYMETTATTSSPTVLLYQRSNEFITNGHYTASFQYRIKPSSSHASMTCYIKAYMDSFTTAGLLGSASQAVSSSTVGWTSLSFDYTPTTSGTHTFEIYGYCTGTTTYTGAAIDIDNVEFVGPPVTSCSTQIITLTSTTTTTTTTTTTSTETSSAQTSSSSSIVSPAVSSPIPSPVTPVVTPSSSVAASSSAITSISSSSAAISPTTHRVSTPIIPASSSVAITSPSSSIPIAASISTGTATTTTATTTTTTMTTSAVSAGTTISASQSTTLATTTLPSQGTDTEGRSTTSTVLSTRTSTITACPSTITNCPASEQTTFVTTETVVASTTICPVQPQLTTTITGDEAPGTPASTTSTVFTTRTATITACPSTVPDCPARAKTTFVTTETLVVSTTICPVTATPTVVGSSAQSTAGSNTNHYGSDAAPENWTVSGTAAPSSSSSSSSSSSPATGAGSIPGSAPTPSLTSGTSPADDSVGATGDVPESENYNGIGSESELQSATFTTARTGFETQYSSSTPAAPVPSSTTSTPGVPAVSTASSAPDALFTGAAPASAMRITYGQLICSLAGCLLPMFVMLV